MRAATLFVMLVSAAALPAQPPGGFPGGGFPGGGPPGGFGGFSRGGDRGGRGGFDIVSMWNSMANGKDVVTRADVPPGFPQMMFDRTLQRRGITDGRITKEAFFSGLPPEMKANLPPEYARFANATPSATPAAPPAPPSQADIDARAEEGFRRRDRDRDNTLNADEMGDSLRAERDKYDADRNGSIDLNEYKAYTKASMEARPATPGTDPNAPPGTAPPPADLANVPDPNQEELDRRPTVFRAGKLPKELPAWFGQQDTNSDGQVGFYEYRKGGEPADKFVVMDRNGDGLLTAEEVLYFQKGAGKTAPPSAAAGRDQMARGSDRSSSDRRDRGSDRGSDRGDFRERMSRDRGERPSGDRPEGRDRRDRGGPPGGDPRGGERPSRGPRG